MSLNPNISNLVIQPIDGTAAAPSMWFGGDPSNNSGTGIYGTYGSIKLSISGTLLATFDSSGLTLASGSIILPVQTANKVLAGPTTGSAAAPAFRALVKADLPVSVITSSAGAGGAATEVMVVTGLLTTDTILSVVQKTPGANSLPLLGWSTVATNAITAIWSADPGAGSVIIVTVMR